MYNMGCEYTIACILNVQYGMWVYHCSKSYDQTNQSDSSYKSLWQQCTCTIGCCSLDYHCFKSYDLTNQSASSFKLPWQHLTCTWSTGCSTNGVSSHLIVCIDDWDKPARWKWVCWFGGQLCAHRTWISDYCLRWWVDNYICVHCVGVRRWEC